MRLIRLEALFELARSQRLREEIESKSESKERERCQEQREGESSEGFEVHGDNLWRVPDHAMSAKFLRLLTLP